jgi:hypothetical protein
MSSLRSQPKSLSAKYRFGYPGFFQKSREKFRQILDAEQSLRNQRLQTKRMRQPPNRQRAVRQMQQLQLAKARVTLVHRSHLLKSWSRGDI